MSISLSPTLDNFRVVIPRSFILKHVAETFEPLIKEVRSPFDNIYDYLEESIKNFEIPSKSFEPAQFRSPTFENGQMAITHANTNQRSNDSLIDLIDSTFNITFRLNDGFLNFFILDYNFFEIYRHNKIYCDDFVVEIYRNDGVKMFDMVYKKPIYTGITGLEFGYDNTVSELTAFTCNFSHNGYRISHNHKQ